MANETSKLCPEGSQVTLWRDRWYDLEQDTAILWARDLLKDTERGEVREVIIAHLGTKVRKDFYPRLRYVLCSLANAKVVKPRRLTWRERITGRLER